MHDLWLFEEQERGLKLSIKYRKKLLRKKSKYQLIEIFETQTHGRVMLLDKKFMVTQKDEFVYHEMLCHVPLFQIKNPQKVLIIGGGDGGAIRECAKHKSVNTIHLCEIDGDVIAASIKFLKFTSSHFTDKRVTTFVEDGFKFLKNPSNEHQYDVIVVDSTDPIGFASKLFGDDFFSLAKKALKKNGILCCQCESPFFLSNTISTTNKSLRNRFGYVAHYTAPVTTYPSGYWSFVIASDKKLGINKEYYKTNYDKNKFRFYNKNIHEGAFCLPNFFEDLLRVNIIRNQE